MKTGLITLLLIPSIVLGASCQQLQEDLIAIDYKLNFEQCDPNIEITCTHKGKYNTLLLEYNKAMAKLIIEEGIVAIGETIENSNNSLAFLKNVDVDQASAYYDKLDNALKKSKIIEAAISPELQLIDPMNKDKKISMWSPSQIPDKKINTLENFKSYIRNHVCTQETKSKLCSEIYKNNSQADTDMKLETLHGFVKADRELMRSFSASASQVKLREFDPTQRYSEYSKKWKINTLNNSQLSSEELRTQLNDQLRLKTLIKKYKSNKNEQTSKELIAAANKIKPIKVNYMSQSSDGVESYLDDVIKKAIHTTQGASASINDSILTGQFKENIENQRKVISQTKNFLKKEIENRKKKSNDASVRFNEKELIAHENLETQMNIIHACFDSKKTATDKKECLEREKKSLYEKGPPKLSLDQLRSNLMSVKDKLSYHNNLKPFKDYLVQKALIVNELSKPTCNKQIKEEKISVKSSALCNADYEDALIDTKAITLLGDNGKDIMLHMQNEIVREALGGGLSDEKIKKYKAQLKKKCSDIREENRDHIKNSCTHFKMAQSSKKESKIRSRSNAKNKNYPRLTLKSNRSISNTDNGSVFLNSFLMGTVSQIPTLVTSWANYDSTKDWHKTTMNSIAQQEEYYIATKDYRAEYIDQLNAIRTAQPEYMTFQNFGTPYIQNGYSFQSTFQSTNTANIYSSTNDPLQNMFNIPTTSTTSTGSETSFSFDVST